MAAEGLSRHVSSASFREAMLTRVFQNLDKDKSGKVPTKEIKAALEFAGLHAKMVKKFVATVDPQRTGEVDKTNFLRMQDLDTNVMERALLGKLVVPDFQTFSKSLFETFQEAAKDNEGNNADYIPQLARQDRENFAAACCTVDGQYWEEGPTDEEYTIQSVSKPITYCIVQEMVGAEKLLKHVGHEPSGLAFNALALDREKRPHNPMINLGAILTSSLLKPKEEQAARFDAASEKFSQMCGSRVGFDNATYLSELEHADRNFSLAYMAKDAGAFDDDVASHSDIVKMLQFYFMLCSILVNTSKAAILAGTLANGGTNPITGVNVFSPDTVRDCLSLMFSCGMYDYSGQFAFEVGLPAKSGVAGLVVLVVPGRFGVATWAPPLDKYGNSSKGVVFCRELVKKYSVHVFDSEGRGKIDPCRREKTQTKTAVICELIFAAANGDLPAILALVNSGASVNDADYDGRTALHVAIAEGRHRVVEYLLGQGANPHKRDRWNLTPLNEAIDLKSEKILELLKTKAGAEFKVDIAKGSPADAE
eukprot:CAMPEP_0119132672 /NCGR_PEP_ID=MMETSP1310-20130426/12026_1 /TAXON_ID=464262 /ORGANISM="Genus nov. species nov., Strain RCC2339" /LENGTH=535 /DNA_ID=CAMNT_0007123317 /DNA_START=94 /DNA_END=1701 /DNA_ORIENTATION=+